MARTTSLPGMTLFAIYINLRRQNIHRERTESDTPCKCPDIESARLKTQSLDFLSCSLHIRPKLSSHDTMSHIRPLNDHIDKLSGMH
jgi:hypothetical protein